MKAEDYWRERCRLAEAYIAESPEDPDIYPEQAKAWIAWKTFQEEHEEPQTGNDHAD